MVVECPTDGSEVSGECLVLFLRSELTLALLRECPEEEFRAEARTYRDQAGDDFTGFYDWLRNRDGRVIGVRYCPVMDVGNLALITAALSYAKARKGGACLEYFFSSSDLVDETVSNDKAFGGNRVFATPSGDYAVSFELYGLSEQEIAEIRQVQAKWIQIVA